MTAEEVLAKAADIVEQGWCQHQLEDSHGNHCALGALIKASEAEVNSLACLSDPAYLGAYRAALRELGGDDWRKVDLVSWNNTPGRTPEEVSSTLRNAKRFV